MEVRDEPNCPGGKYWPNTLRELIELRLCKAVEEEVRNHKVVAFAFKRSMAERIGLADAEATLVWGAALAEKAQHCDARVDGRCVESGIRREQL
jgi:hypothetical protein